MKEVKEIVQNRVSGIVTDELPRYLGLVTNPNVPGDFARITQKVESGGDLLDCLNIASHVSKFRPCLVRYPMNDTFAYLCIDSYAEVRKRIAIWLLSRNSQSGKPL